MGPSGVWLFALTLTMLLIATHVRRWRRAHNGTYCL